MSPEDSLAPEFVEPFLTGRLGKPYVYEASCESTQELLGADMSHGALALAGAACFVIGALMLFDPAGPEYQVSLWTALAIAGTLVLLIGLALSRIVRARRNPVETGVSLLVGEEAQVRPGGLVALNGELWRAHHVDGAPLTPGETVTVEAVEENLVLTVGSSNHNREDA